MTVRSNEFGVRRLKTRRGGPRGRPLWEPAEGLPYAFRKDSEERHQVIKYSEIRNPRSAIGNKGFTLIEIIILIVMAGILLPAIIVPFVSAVKSSGKPEMATIAMFLAQEKMEEFTINEYLESPLDPISLTSYADIAGFLGYQWQWEILYVDSYFNVVGDGIQPSNHRGYKRILVRVKDPQNDTYEIYSVVGLLPQ